MRCKFQQKVFLKFRFFPPTLFVGFRSGTRLRVENHIRLNKQIRQKQIKFAITNDESFRDLCWRKIGWDKKSETIDWLSRRSRSSCKVYCFFCDDADRKALEMRILTIVSGNWFIVCLLNCLPINHDEWHFTITYKGEAKKVSLIKKFRLGLKFDWTRFSQKFFLLLVSLLFEISSEFILDI